MAGLAGNNAPALLHQALTNAAPQAVVNWKISTFSGGAADTYCRALDLLRPVAAPFGAGTGGFALDLAGNKTVLADGDPIILDVVMPDFPAWLTVDYFSSDGSVAHLAPGPFTANRLEVAGTAVELRPGAAGQPYGRDMIVAIASSQPLFKATRPETEQASAYLSALAAALDAAQGAGVRLDATAFLLETHKKP